MWEEVKIYQNYFLNSSLGIQLAPELLSILHDPYHCLSEFSIACAVTVLIKNAVRKSNKNFLIISLNEAIFLRNALRIIHRFEG